MQRFELGRVVFLPGYSGEHFGEDDQVQNHRGGEQRVLAGVMHHDRVLAAHEDLGRVLVHGPLAVANVRHIFDHDDVIGLLARRIKDPLGGGDHVVDDGGLGHFLRSELLGCREVLAIVVAEVVVAHDRHGLDTSLNEKIHQNRLEFSLAGLKVVSSDDHVMTNSQFNGSRNKCILRASIDIRAPFQNAGNGKESRGRYFSVSFLDGSEKMISCVVDFGNDLAKPLRGGRPKNNNLS
mmetsp:Transcript_23076/g.39650  ORF Transcript_23076/g.39650 Transcript_23076/m.39650 type:complete len:237 (+) Transcript_23076:617-1327(+)